MTRKVSRRDFARTSVAVAGAVALPNALLGAGTAPAAVTEPTVAALQGAAAARRRLKIAPPPHVAYGGDAASAISEYRDRITLANTPLCAAQGAVIGGWREGTTIPSEYYIDDKHYVKDERFIGEHLWFLADHVNRIPKPGDYFVFEYGRGDSIIALRNKAGEVKAYHNVCRHRGSRLCRHDDDPAPKDARLSVKQLGATGNTPVFRCPYHAWTYDLDGRLISAPNGMPADFDMASIALRPCHLRTTEGFIFLNFSSQDPPDFEEAVKTFAAVAKEYGTADLKIAARVSAPTKANWKLVLENFQECYHCGPAHRNLVTTHPFWDGLMGNEQRSRLAQQVEQYAAGLPQQRSGTGGMSGPGGYGGNLLNVGFVSGTVDGKAAAPLLPARKEWTHRSRAVSTGWSTGYLQCYDDHVAVARFTPRDVRSTDAELFWLVRADAKEGKDYNPERIKALWDITYREDRWITENNHAGIQSGFYSSGRYAAVETGPTRFIQWYMTQVVPAASTSAD
jgi:Rieske 2Fe-2S family protein